MEPLPGAAPNMLRPLCHLRALGPSSFKSKFAASLSTRRD